MLHWAEKYETELNTILIKHFTQNKNQWYYTDIKNRQRLKIQKDRVQVVSKDDNGLIGFINARYNSRNKTLYGVIAVSFEKNNAIFIRDIIEFFYLAYQHYDIQKINWATYEDAPFYPLAKKMANRFGVPVEWGRVKKLLPDGKLHTLKSFSLSKDTINFEKAEKLLIRKKDV